jgi:hypothetical protein
MENIFGADDRHNYRRLEKLQSISCECEQFLFLAISYIIMFVYITFSLGQTGKCSFSRWEIRAFSFPLTLLLFIPYVLFLTMKY